LIFTQKYYNTLDLLVISNEKVLFIIDDFNKEEYKEIINKQKEMIPYIGGFMAIEGDCVYIEQEEPKHDKYK
jgi:hypothetical protein